MKDMVQKKDWSTFRSTGLLLYINQILHVFGWAIVFEFDQEGKLKEVYPARVKFRGFDENTVSDSYEKITTYLSDNIQELKEEIKE